MASPADPPSELPSSSSHSPPDQHEKRRTTSKRKRDDKEKITLPPLMPNPSSSSHYTNGHAFYDQQQQQNYAYGQGQMMYTNYVYPPPQPPPHLQHPPQPPHPSHQPQVLNVERRQSRSGDDVEPSPASAKRRKRESSRDDEEPQSASSSTGLAQSQAATALALDVKKRTKTQRACDSCRSRKIRCDVITDTDPPLCQHCKQYGFECTFFLPITETRFRKKKNDPASPPLPPASLPTHPTTYADAERIDRATTPASEPTVLGPTSATFLLHSTATLPSRAYEHFDSRWNHTFDVTASGDGLIQVQPSRGTSSSPASPTQPTSSLPKPIDMRNTLTPAVLQKLVNSYFTAISPQFPVVTQSDLLSTQPPALLLYSVCLAAATQRDVPLRLFDGLRTAVSALLRDADVLGSPSATSTVQALLVVGMNADSGGGISAVWQRLGAAIRMAQDLGFHRAEALSRQDDSAQLALRRRMWAVCVVADRWSSLVYGQPSMIDIADCDARLPSEGEHSHAQYLAALVRLSVLLGRVLKTIYGPAGLTHATDSQLEALLNDLTSWKRDLPGHLQFRNSTESGMHPGLLHMLYTSVCMLFWRVFMRISYCVPTHLRFTLSVERWSDLVRLSRESIEWLDLHERAYDCWMLVSYAATSCALVQYHTFARRRDGEAVRALRTLRDCVRRWEASQPQEHMSLRRKTCEIISLLYEATQEPRIPPPPSSSSPGPLNPTPGVAQRPPSSLSYRPDSSRPGGGVFIASRPDPSYAELAPGTVLTEGGGASNLNPAAVAGGSVPTQHVLNVLDAAPPGMDVGQGGDPQGGGGRGVVDFESFALADGGLLEGIPGSMFDWPQWDNFFSRFSMPSGEMSAFAPASASAPGGAVPMMGQGQNPMAQNHAHHGGTPSLSRDSSGSGQGSFSSGGNR